MKFETMLNRYLRNAPAVSCWHYDAKDVVVCAAKGAAKNRFSLRCETAVVALIPEKAIVVLSGRHPSNALTGKASAKARFKSAFPKVSLLERSHGQSKPEIVIV